MPVPDGHSRIIILTSGTTGTPKGAPRNEAGIDAAISLLSRMPLRYGWRVHIAAPLFHTWGFAHLMLSLLLGHTIVLRRKFDPEAALDLVDEQQCDGMVVIPVMLQRMLGLPDETLDAHSLETVKVVAASGSALPGDLALSWMDRFGDNLYNTYGSTEVAYASIATPEDMRAGADHGGQAAVGDRREDLRRRGHGAAAGGVGPDLRRQQPALRGLHRRRPQGHDRRPDVLRGRGPLRRARAASTSRAATTR